MRAIKALVIGMGVLIVAGIVILVVAVVDRAGTPEAAFAPAEIAIPADAEIAETTVGDGRIVLRLKFAAGGGRLVVIDAATGRVSGIVELRKQR